MGAWDGRTETLCPSYGPTLNLKLLRPDEHRLANQMGATNQMAKKTIAQILKSLGYVEGQHYNFDRTATEGITFNDDAAIQLYDYIDQLSTEGEREYVRLRHKYSKARKAAAADREKAKKEQQERDKRMAEARKKEIQEKQDNAIHARIKRANPYATDEEIEKLLPKVKEAEMLKRTLEGAGSGAGFSGRLVGWDTE